MIDLKHKIKSIRIYYLVLWGSVVLTNCTGTNKTTELLRIHEAFSSGKLEESLKGIEQFLEKDPTNVHAWTLAGHIYTKADQDSLASISYEKAIKLNPNTVEAVTGLGILARKEGEYDKATKYYEKAIEIDPKYAQAHSSVVTIYLIQRKFKEAVDAGIKGYELDKTDPVIMANLAIAYHYYGDTIQRNKYYRLAEKSGYRGLQKVRQIFDDELTVFE